MQLLTVWNSLGWKINDSNSEKETQKGKMKNPKFQKSKRCENVISNNRIIQKSKSSNIQKMWKCEIQ